MGLIEQSKLSNVTSALNIFDLLILNLVITDKNMVTSVKAVPFDVMHCYIARLSSVL